MTKKTSSDDKTQRGRGRPPKGSAPAFPGDEVDHLLVFGEQVVFDESGREATNYPSYRELAERYGVASSLIARYSKEHNCLARRKQAKARVTRETDAKLIEIRAEAIALSKCDLLAMIDEFLVAFEKSIAEGRVRCDNPGDFNTMVRLREFLQGGADSRQELHASLSLAELQTRYQEHLERERHTTPEMRGEVSSCGPAASPHEGPPRARLEDAPQEVDEHFGEPGPDDADAAATLRGSS